MMFDNKYARAARAQSPSLFARSCHARHRAPAHSFNWTGYSFVGDEPSRLLIMEVDEDQQTAREVWELKLDDQTCIYGDNDRLPSGNLLGSSWPVVIDASLDFQYDARIFEIVRATKQTAWELFVVGRRCEKPLDGSSGCVRTQMGGHPKGWSMYSVERFYEAPLVTNITCGTDPAGAGTHLNFTTHNNFKVRRRARSRTLLTCVPPRRADERAAQRHVQNLRGGAKH